VQTWTPAQLRRFLNHVRDDWLYAAWLLSARTGMRRGEVLGIRGPLQQRIARALGEIGFALPGNITQRMMRCGKRTCRCKHDPPQLHGPYIQWTRTVEGKTVTKLLTAEQLERYQPWFDNAHQLRALATDLETLSIDTIIKSEGWGR